MPDCNKIISDIYQSKVLIDFIEKVRPESIRDDLHQEIALSLLEQPCERITVLYSEEALLKYTIRTCWIMATSKTSSFYSKHRKSDLLKAIEYLRSQQGKEIPISYALTAQEVLQNKTANINEDHERRIFDKFIELRSGRKVAAYYNIPAHHCCKIIRKVQNELKCIIRQ